MTSELSAGTAAQLPFTSLPAWARPAPEAPQPAPTTGPTVTGTSYVLVGVGDAAHAAQDRRVPALPARASISRIRAEDAADAAERLQHALATATVGLRVLIAGPVGACLKVRAAAVAAGLEDDEISVDVVGSGPIDVFCSHCRTVTTADAGMDDLVDCAGCGRELLVYYHVSRRKGAFLGFMADAESIPDPTTPTSQELPV